MLSKQLIFKITSICLGILSIPFIAMQFTDQVQWKIGDFLIAALLLFTSFYCLAIITKNINSKKTKLLLITLTIALFILIWAELAVGLFGF